MPAIINSAPDCVTHGAGSESARVDDSADFILQNNFQDCAGFGTFMPGSTYGEEGTGAETVYMILTWLGIVVMVAVLVAWVLYENRRLIAAVAGYGGPTSPAGGPRAPARRSGRHGKMINNGSSKRQIEFLPLQTHKKSFELAMLAISILCAIVVLVIVLFTNIGTEFRPTV